MLWALSGAAPSIAFTQILATAVEDVSMFKCVPALCLQQAVPQHDMTWGP